MNRKGKKCRIIGDYEVQGAGIVRLECRTHISSCGTANGISVGVSWGKFGSAGGVMDKKDVKRLVKDLTCWLKNYKRLER